MSVSTGKGDRGRTGLLFGHRVPKDSARIEANGTLDELNAILGLAKAAIRRKWVKDIIHTCQRDIFIASSEIASLPRELPRLELRIDKERITWIESTIHDLEKTLTLEVCCFLIPGGNEREALLDVARCVARRAERLVVGLHRKKAVPNARVLAYLNRLSDLLWLLARAEEQKHVPFKA
jgi:cob(I)alamin adenosyltransferase